MAIYFCCPVTCFPSSDGYFLLLYNKIPHLKIGSVMDIVEFESSQRLPNSLVGMFVSVG